MVLILTLLLVGCGDSAPRRQPVTTSGTGDSRMQSLIEQLRNWPPSSDAKLDTFFSELIPLFLDADDETRSQVRHAVSATRSQRAVAGVGAMEQRFRHYAFRAAISLHRKPENDMYAGKVAHVPVAASDNDELFRLGVGALAIEDCTDYRGSMTTLAELCIRAEKAGVTPRRHLEQLASKFSDKLIGGFGNEERPYHLVVRDFRKPK